MAMQFYKKPLFWAGLVLTVLVLLVLYGGFVWFVERVEVPPGKFLVLTHRWGKDLAPGEILAPDEDHKGVMLEVLPEGRHYLNPFVWSYEVRDMVVVPPGK